MVRFIINFFLLASILIIAACANENSQNERGDIEVPANVSVEETKDHPAESVDEKLEVEIEIDSVPAPPPNPRYELQADHSVVPISEADLHQVVLLTIDDAPNRYAVEMAHLLKQRNISAIFFVNGHFIQNDEGKAKLKTIHDLGFEIGNHTMTHQNLSQLSEEQQREEIVELNDLIEEITGTRPRFFRAPFGVNTDVSKRVVKEEAMQWMNWTYGYDFEKNYMEKEALADIMVNTSLLRPGANLLMHDHLWTLEALPIIISGLEEKGYEFVDPKEIK